MSEEPVTFYVSVIEDYNSRPEVVDLDDESDIYVGSEYLPKFFENLGNFIYDRGARLNLWVRLETATEAVIVAIGSIYRKIKEKVERCWSPRFDLDFHCKYLKINPIFMDEKFQEECEAFNYVKIFCLCDPCEYWKENEFVYLPVKDYRGVYHKAVKGRHGISGYVHPNFELTDLHRRYFAFREAFHMIIWHNRFIIEADQDYQDAHRFTGIAENDQHDLFFY